MTTSLTWDDLLIQKFAPEETRLWLGYWSGISIGKVSPVFMSKFGDWFLRQPDGKTCELSVIEGTYKTVASTEQEFKELVNSQDWQEEHLLSKFVQDLHERNVIPNPGQCYAFAPHPAFHGQIDLDRAKVMDVGVWQSICAQTFGYQQPEI